MAKVVFSIDGVKGDFACESKEFESYKTLKALSSFGKDPQGFFDAVERIYMGRDEEYVGRLGGGMDALTKLNDAAALAVKAKKESAS